jgi:hypothetical protein
MKPLPHTINIMGTHGIVTTMSFSRLVRPYLGRPPVSPVESQNPILLVCAPYLGLLGLHAARYAQPFGSLLPRRLGPARGRHSALAPIRARVVTAHGHGHLASAQTQPPHTHTCTRMGILPTGHDAVPVASQATASPPLFAQTPHTHALPFSSSSLLFAYPAVKRLLAEHSHTSTILEAPCTTQAMHAMPHRWSLTVTSTTSQSQGAAFLAMVASRPDTRTAPHARGHHRVNAASYTHHLMAVVHHVKPILAPAQTHSARCAHVVAWHQRALVRTLVADAGDSPNTYRASVSLYPSLQCIGQ